MAKPGLYNIHAYKGDTLEESFTIEKNGIPVDLSTATLRLAVRLKPGDPDPFVYELTEGNGITVSGAGSNIVNLSKIVNIAAGIYNYDLQAVFASGVVKTFLYGKFTVTQDVTPSA